MLRPDAFRSEISFAPGSWVIALFGELDLATAAEAETVVRIVRAAKSRVTLDLRGLQFMDASGASLIVRLHTVTGQDGCDLCVVAAGGVPRRVLEIVGLDALVDVVDTPPPSESGSRVEYAVIATDLEGLVTVWNSQAQRLYGWSALEVLGKPIVELTVGPEDRQVAETIMVRVRTDGHWEGEFEVRSKTGNRFRAHVRDAVIRDENGNATGVLGLSVKSHSGRRSDRAPATSTTG